MARKTVIWANYHFSMGSPLKALQAFKDAGFSEAKLKWLNKCPASDIVSRIVEGKPLLVMGLHPPFDGHAWVVDGYLRRVRDKVSTDSKGRVLKTERETAEYLHCNFGWGGAANGYYPFGQFDTAAGPVFRHQGKDLYGGKTAPHHFSCFLHFIDY